MEEIENNTIDLIQYLYTVMKKRGIWFTQKQDPTWEEPKSYFKLDEYGDLTEASAKQVEKEIENLIGDGAVDLVDAVNKWVDMNLCNYKIAYKETLVTQFKQKEVVDGIGAVECRHQLAESQKLQEDEYDDYRENEKKLADDYKARVKADISDKARKHFRMLQDIIEEGEDKVNVDGWYYPEKAVYVVKQSDLSYHLNPYMDLTVANILNMVNDNESIEAAIDELFNEYKADSAYSWADNFISKLDKLDFSVLDDLEEYTDDDEYVFEVRADGRDSLAFTSDWTEDSAKRVYLDNEGIGLTLDDLEIVYLDESKNENKKVTEALSMEKLYDLVDKSNNQFQLAGAVHAMSYVDGGVAGILQNQFSSMKKNGTDFVDIKDKLLDTISANMVDGEKEKIVASKETKTEDIISKDGTRFSEKDLKKNWIEELMHDLEDGETLEQRMKECPFDKWKADLLDTNDFKKVEMKTENAKARLKEENNKSQNVISDMMTSPEFDSESNQGKIVLRTSELFNVLSAKGYDVQTTFDNGESQNTILLGQQGGVINITVNSDNQPLRAFTSGSFEVNEDNLNILQDVMKEIKVV